MRSMSPIVTRQISKRRYTNSGNNSGLDSSDNEGPPLSSKRQCTSFSKSCGSPLVRDAPLFYNPNFFMPGSESPFHEPQSLLRGPSPSPSESSTTSSIFSTSKSRANQDPSSFSNLSNAATVDSDEASVVNDEMETTNDLVLPKDDQSSTAFSSRACTPIDEGSDNSRLPDEGPQQCTTPTGLIRTFTAGSPFNGRFPLPPSPLASQRLRDSDF